MLQTPTAVFAFYAGALGLLLLLLSILTVQARLRTRTLIGDGGKAELIKAQRAHGNASEYIPIGLLLLLVLVFLNAPAWGMHLVGGTMLLGRLLHAWGLHSTTGVSRGRFLGMVLTWMSMFAGALAALAGAFSPLLFS